MTAFITSGASVVGTPVVYKLTCRHKRANKVSRQASGVRMSLNNLVTSSQMLAEGPSGFQPQDAIFVGAAVLIMVGAFYLQKSLGDVVADEAGLPPSAGAKSRREAQRSRRFIKKDK
mmetsp:Transcript_756/g.1269  ORF Transcript_756/g.1269 Transcript_756/m.1269 type:complete len:117 (-) Transcript_756:548-898(-)|eukprot:CAMPEP_0184697198 /NCGR_PEP_ID=MMETSP0313-20130426/4232_1 /TAXON_ID=2792 /ORGANISM="Porphyridium aerugineum, Strain SAG 1380-2" /LENGTH=116 /DNA_ID=CAMNT_0027155961 /DNA_START=90 /DNA_END=440 /DNA_ORIENTATION=-